MRNAWAYTLLGLSIALALPALLLSFAAEKLNEAYTLLGLSIALALPALLLSFAAEKLNDWADDHLD